VRKPHDERRHHGEVPRNGDDARTRNRVTCSEIYNPLPSEQGTLSTGSGEALEGSASLFRRTGERPLTTPAGVSVENLRLDPRWDPLRSDPRFQRLLARTRPVG
jgi:hypothetical protein